MSTFVLLHGAWHGAWCWYKMLPRLERAGHIGIAVDLPGLGRDTTPLDTLSLAAWTEHVRDVIAGQPGPVVLVGHSRAGIVLSSVAEQAPEKIDLLVYLTASLLRDNETLGQLLRDDGTSEILPNLRISADGLSTTVADEGIRSAIYAECADEDVALAKLLLRPEPRAVGATLVPTSAARFGSVPRAYIECLRDRTIPIAVQRRMQSALPCAHVTTLDTDHSPFFSAPDALLKALVSSLAARRNAA